MRVHRAILSLFLLFLGSCLSNNRLDGFVVFRINSNPTTLDPGLIVDVNSATIAAKLFNGLVRLDESLTIQPDIAEKWNISPDGRTYTFYLRKGVRFLNGREVRAEDFKYSFERVLSPQSRSPNTWVLDKIEGAKEFIKGTAKEVKGIKVLGDRILRLRLEQPHAAFLALLTMTPAYVVPREEAQKPDFSTNPSGTGPFFLKKWSHNNELILERREDYFEGPARIKGIIYRIIPEDLTAITEFELSNIDILSLPASALRKYRTDPVKRHWLISGPSLNIYYLGMNCSKPPLDNLLLRRAIGYAIDRKKILDTTYEKRGILANSIIPPPLKTWGTTPNLSYNPLLSKKLIKKSGYKGEELQFYVTSDQEVIDIAEVIQEYLRGIGLNVKIRQLEWSAYKEALIKGEEHLFWLSWWADYPDPENFLFPLFHSSNFGAKGNRTRYKNPEVDTLIEMGQKTLEKKRQAWFYKKAEEIILKEAPVIPFWHKKEFVLKQPWIEGYRLMPVYSIDKGTSLELRTQVMALFQSGLITKFAP